MGICIHRYVYRHIMKIREFVEPEVHFARYLYMYMCIHADKYIYMCTYICIQAYICTLASSSSCNPLCLIFVYEYVYMHVYLCVYLSIYVYIHVYTYVCTHIYVNEIKYYTLLDMGWLPLVGSYNL